MQLCWVGCLSITEASQQRLEQHIRMQLNVNDEVMSLLRYENKLQREIVKELGFVSIIVYTRFC